MDDMEAARALKAMQAARGALADRAKWSLARHAAFGLVIGGLIAGYALPAPWPIVVAAICLVATAMIVWRDRQRDGFFINGYRRGRTRWVTFALLAAALGALTGAIVLKMQYGLDWAPLAIGAIVAALATIGSIGWERLYRQELNGTRDEC